MWHTLGKGYQHLQYSHTVLPNSQWLKHYIMSFQTQLPATEYVAYTRKRVPTSTRLTNSASNCPSHHGIPNPAVCIRMCGTQGKGTNIYKTHKQCFYQPRLNIPWCHCSVSDFKGLKQNFTTILPADPSLKPFHYPEWLHLLVKYKNSASTQAPLGSQYRATSMGYLLWNDSDIGADVLTAMNSFHQATPVSTTGKYIQQIVCHQFFDNCYNFFFQFMTWICKSEESTLTC